MAEPTKRLNREAYAAGVAARVRGRPREAPDNLPTAGLEADWRRGWDSVSAAQVKRTPEVRTPEPVATMATTWPKGQPMPQRYVVRAPMPCKSCRAVLQRDGTQAVITSHVWGGVAGFLCRCCGKRFKLPVDREEIPGAPAPAGGAK